MNPIATLHMENGSKIVIELLVEAAPNTVNSFIYAAANGYMDRHAIERIVPGDWVDISCTAFGKEECKYLIPNEFDLNPELVPLDSHPGVVAMGGYDNGISGCEFFFPLRDCPEHKGIYPVFGRVLEGMEEIRRLESVDMVPVPDYPFVGLKTNRPVEPQVIERVELELFGQSYPEPVKLTDPKLPPCWEF